MVITLFLVGLIFLTIGFIIIIVVTELNILIVTDSESSDFENESNDIFSSNRKNNEYRYKINEIFNDFNNNENLKTTCEEFIEKNELDLESLEFGFIPFKIVNDDFHNYKTIQIKHKYNKYDGLYSLYSSQFKHKLFFDEDEDLSWYATSSLYYLHDENVGDNYYKFASNLKEIKVLFNALCTQGLIKNRNVDYYYVFIFFIYYLRRINEYNYWIDRLYDEYLDDEINDEYKVMYEIINNNISEYHNSDIESVCEICCLLKNDDTLVVKYQNDNKDKIRYLCNI